MLQFLYNLTNRVSVIFFIFYLMSCGVSKQLPKTSVQQSKDDIILLKKILEANHPSLYWYTPKDSIDAAFNEAIQSINDSLTHLQLKNKIAAIVSKIGCGHTGVRFSKNYTKQLTKYKGPIFPLGIKAWSDSLVVLGSAYKNDSIFRRGTIITSINNKKPKQLLDSMFTHISTDGYSNNFKNQLVSYNFGNYYRNSFGLDSSYIITYLDQNKTEQTAVIKNFIAKKDTTTLKPTDNKAAPQKKPSRKEKRMALLATKRNVAIDTALSSAYFNITTFSNAGHRRFYKKAFKQIKKLGIKNVVIDLRQNGGGNILLSTKLAQYISNNKFKVADTVARPGGHLAYGKYFKPNLFYRLTMLFTTSKKADGKKHFGYFERHYFKPKDKYHFKGSVYVMQGGYSFSASTLFINIIKGQKNIQLVGEETGGASYGNSAVFLPQITLPNSGIRVGLPLFRLVMNKDSVKTGRGIIPDINLPPSSASLRAGYDPKIEYIKSVLKKKVAG